MQELKVFTFRALRRTDSGSALVAAVAFSLILFITSVGYLQLLASTRNNEVESLRDAKAFQAAESGLLVATRWLSQQPNLPSADITGVYSLQFGEIQVDVDILAVSAKIADIQSTTSSGKMAYDKRLSWRVGPLPAGSFGTFLNAVQGNVHRNQKGFLMTTFDGPTHTNETIKLTTPNAGAKVGVTFLDRVSVHQSSPPNEGERLGVGSHHNNDYNYGIDKDGKDDPGTLDDIFTDRYRHHQDRLALSQVTAPTIDLPASKSYPADPAKRAYLELNGSSATYHFYDASGAYATKPYADIDGKVILSPNELSVSGTASGRVTVKTEVGHNLYPVGDIIYEGFEPELDANYENFDHSTNYGIPEGAEDALALVSGKDIYFAPGWKHPKNPEVDRPVKGSLATGKSIPLHITASLVAVETGGTHKFDYTVNGQDQIQVKTNVYDKTLVNGGIRIIGSRTLDEWFQVTTGADPFMRLYYDQRLRAGLDVPGILGFKRIIGNGDSALVLAKGSWKEENIDK